MTRIKKILEITVLAVISLLMMLLIVLVTMGVIMRYVFNAPLTFSEELSRYAMIWLGLIGSSYVFLKNQHTAFTVIKERVSQKNAWLRKYYNTILSVLIIIFALLISIGGVIVVRDNFSQVSAIMRWQMGYVYLCIPISMMLIVIFQIINIIEDIRGKQAL